jgi:spore germination cell wall hydrolase CwlJ-like protein
MRLATTLLLAFFVFLSTTTQADTIPTAHVVTQSLDNHSFDTVETFEVPESVMIQNINNIELELSKYEIPDAFMQEDVYYLSRTMWGEARGEGRIGMLHVGSVILNRLKHPRYPKTVKDVVLQASQFSVWNRRNKNYRHLIYADDVQMYQAQQLAVLLLKNGPINDYLTFESKRTGRGGKIIGNHRFKV